MQFLLHHLVRDSAIGRGDATAVIDRDRSVTYAELDIASNRVANLLIGAGVGRGDRVGLYLDKSIESIVGIYGVLKAGAAYVPLDPQAPAARLAYIARNCDISVLLSGTEKSKMWRELTLEGAPLSTIIVMNGPASGDVIEGVEVRDAEDVAREAPTMPQLPSIGLDLAYILYTSGSTGQPKGVKLTHLNALAFVDWAVDRLGVFPDDRLSSHAPLHFDLSVFDVFAAAKAGAALVLVPPETSVFPVEVARFIKKNEITIWYSVPSILTMLTTRGGLTGGDFPNLRTILFAGEVFPTKFLRQLMTFLPHVSFFNLYGPTETNVCTYYEVPVIAEDQVEPIPIGSAISGVEVFAVTDDGRRAERGEIGELYARGPTVMQGYWADPERTARGLVPHPLDPELRDLAYRTGDIVQEMEDGNFRFLGRRDSQIKSRGYRIELGDIETAIYAHPNVVECAVTVIPDEMITNRIKAYVVVRDALTASDLMQFCAGRIPRYMIPELFELRNTLPKTSTGKIDRQALKTSDIAG